jgi:hypothetical protein
MAWAPASSTSDTAPRKSRASWPSRAWAPQSGWPSSSSAGAPARAARRLRRASPALKAEGLLRAALLNLPLRAQGHCGSVQLRNEQPEHIHRRALPARCGAAARPQPAETLHRCQAAALTPRRSCSAGVFEAGCFPGCWYELSVFFTSLEARPRAAPPPRGCLHPLPAACACKPSSSSEAWRAALSWRPVVDG